MSAGPRFESGGGDGETTDGGGTSEDPRRQQDDEPDEPDRGGEVTGPGPGDDGPQTGSGDPTRTTSKPVGQRPDEPTGRGERVDVSERPRVASELEQQFEEQLDRDVEPGRDFAVFRRGDRFVGRATGGFRAALSREAARAAGRDLTQPAGTQRFGAPTGPAFASGGAAVGTRTFAGTRFIGTPDVRETGGGEDLPVATGGGPEAQLERELEEAVREETGREVDLDPETDITFATVDGRRTATLSAAGMDKVATQPLTRAVSEFERARPPGGLGVFSEATGVTVEGAGGPIARGVGEQRDFGQIDVRIPVFGRRPTTPGPRIAPRPQVGTTTLEAELAGTMEAIDVAVEPRTGAFAAQFVEEDAEELAEQDFTSAERRRQELTSIFTERAVEAPAMLPVAGTKFLKDVGEFGVEAGGAAARGDVERLEELGTGAGQTALNLAAVGAARGIEAPGRTAAGAAGTLVGSGFLFAGAAAAGPRASLATRALVQPGEEALGIGGHAVTRRAAGRGTAERLFPGKEPLIFSEEAALRGARRGVAGARRRAPDISRGIERIRGRAGELGLSTDVPDLSRGLERQFAAMRGETRVPVIERRPSRTRTTINVEGDIPVTGPGGEVTTEPDEPEPFEAGEPPEPGGGGGVVGGRFIDIERRTGTGTAEVMRLRFEPPTELETRPLEAELFEAETMRPRFETALGTEQVTAEAQRPAVDQDLGMGLEQRQRPRLDFDPDQETELGLEFDFETELAAEGRAEQELEAELELEAEMESELELEPRPREPPSRRRQPDFRMGFTERQFVAPTGTVGQLLGFGRRRREPTGFVGPVTGGGDFDFEV